MKRCARFAWALARTLVVVWMLGAAWVRAAPPEATAESVYVLGVADTDDAACERLHLLLGRPVTQLPREASVGEVLARDPDAVVLVIDSGRARVARYRADDVEPLVRELASPQPSPYQMAFVAAEMLPLDGRAQLIAPEGPPTRAPRAHGLLRLEAVASDALAGMSPLLEWGGALGAGLHLSEVRSLELELHAGYGHAQSRPLDVGELTAARSRVRLRTSLVRSFRRLEAALGLELGVARSFVQVDAYPEQARRSVSAALRCEGRALLGPHWGVFLAGGAGVQAARHGFAVQGELVARERRYVVEAQLGLLVVLGHRAGSLHHRGGLE